MKRRALWRIARAAAIAYLVVLLAMMLLENRLVYAPPPVDQGDWKPPNFAHDDIWFESADGTKLHGWFVPHANAVHAILYCHGNAEDVARLTELAELLRDKLRASVLLFDYRGYGRSEGKPSEMGCIADGNAAQHWLANRMRLQTNQVILMGRSLGGGVAVALAAQNGARALVLENTFSRMPDAAAVHYPWLPVRWVMDNRYDSVARIGDYRGPLMQSHGTTDSIVSIAFGRKLFDAAPGGPKKWIEFAGLGHNDPWPLSYYDELASFLNTIEATKTIAAANTDARP